MTVGICKLTKAHGAFVKAHIIPAALTKPATPGQPFIQGGEGTFPVQRWTSWYDNRLVTREGEEILAKFDAWAISKLRQFELVWSGWGAKRILTAEHTKIPGTDWGIRKIEGVDTKKLRVFLLSLLWRAAATERWEFSKIELPDGDLEQLRLMLLKESSEPISFYPIHLLQLSTIGPIHNHSPLATTKRITALGDQAERHLPIFRFYFDGLVVHFHRPAVDDTITEDESLSVGPNSTLIVPTVTYETSFQRKALINIQADAMKRWSRGTAKR